MIMPRSLKTFFILLASKKEGSDSARQPTSNGWTDSLARVSTMLDGIIAGSEDEFLTIGKKLKEFHMSAQEMCAQSGVIVQIMTGESLNRSTEGLSNILDELKSHLEESERHFDKITNVFREHIMALGRVSSHLEDLNMLVLNLSMLGFLTRVENAHIISHNSGFSSLTDDVRRLAENIKQKSHHIDAVSQNVKGFITHSLSQVASFEKTQRESARTAHMHAVANYQALSRQNESASGSARIIEQKSKEIASSISNIIMSMQFHDITRQQIEHVKEVFNHLCANISQKGQDNIQHAALMRDVLELQRAQLEKSEDDLISAVFKIIENLQAISKSVGEILSETHDVAWASETEGPSFMDDLDNGISSVIEFIKITSDEQTKITDIVASASEMVAEMSGFVRDIETLGLNLQLIALNARIRAAHLGREGAALDTISGSIYEMSLNARQDTKALTEILAGLVALSIGFKEDLISMQDEQSRTVSFMVGKLKELITSLHHDNDQVLSMLTDMTTLGGSLLRDIRTTADGIVVHKDMVNKLNDVMTVVEETAENARQICPSGDNTAAMLFLADIDKLYTMKSERDIHLEHFDTSRTEDQSGGINTGDELGENVELF